MGEKTKKLLKRLDERIQEVQSSDEFKEMLKTFSQFHDYSYHNSLLINLQYPEATFVAGFRQWKEKFNRNVKKGEDGIAILAPFSSKVEIEVEEEGENKTKEIIKTYFRRVYVFDVSQTEGEPLPKVDTSLEDEFDKLLEPLIAYAKNKNVDVKIEEINENIEGYYNDGKIVINKDLNDTEKASVLLHELAHFILHFNKNRDELNKEIKEMEAEAISYIVMYHYGIEIKSDNYLALYKKNYDIKESLNKINKVSSKIIDHCDDYLSDNK